jgi:hypothetical protein
MIVIFIAAVVGLSSRLFLAYTFHGNYDQISFEIVSDIMMRGGNVYAETERYNYAPLWAYILLALRWIADSTYLPFHFIIRSFLAAIDCINAALSALLMNRIQPSKPRTVFLSIF